MTETQTDIAEIKHTLGVMQQDIDNILKAIETREYTRSPEMEDKVFNMWQKQYDGGPVSKMSNDYYYTLYPDVSTKPLAEQEKKTAFAPITEVETRTYYCGPLSKCRNEDVFDYAIYDHD